MHSKYLSLLILYRYWLDLLTHPPAQSYYVLMENYTTDSRLKEQVTQLEETLTLLLSTTEKLFDENTSLKQREKQLLTERADLNSKNDKIRSQVEAMISRLKAMDKV